MFPIAAKYLERPGRRSRRAASFALRGSRLADPADTDTSSSPSRLLFALLLVRLPSASLSKQILENRSRPRFSFHARRFARLLGEKVLRLTRANVSDAGSNLGRSSPPSSRLLFDSISPQFLLADVALRKRGLKIVALNHGL